MAMAMAMADMASMLRLIIAEARRTGSVEPYLTMLKDEITRMASPVLAKDLREDAAAEAMLRFITLWWPRIDRRRNTNAICVYLRMTIHAFLTEYDKKDAKRSRVELLSSQEALEPVAPTHTPDPLAEESFRETIAGLAGREHQMASLLGHGESLASAAKHMGITKQAGWVIGQHIRARLERCAV
jgi:hypothetical protein